MPSGSHRPPSTPSNCATPACARSPARPRVLVAGSVARRVPFAAMAAWAQPGRSKATPAPTPADRPRRLRPLRSRRLGNDAANPPASSRRRRRRRTSHRRRTAPVAAVPTTVQTPDTQYVRAELPVRAAARGVAPVLRSRDGRPPHLRRARHDRHACWSRTTPRATTRTRSSCVRSTRSTPRAAASATTPSSSVRQRRRGMAADARSRRCSWRRSTPRSRAARITDGIVDPTVGTVDARARLRPVVRHARPHRPPAPGDRAARARLADRRGGPVRSTVHLPAGVELDFGATAKALCADRAAAAIADATGAGVLVSLGGDVAVRGAAPEHGWPVLIADNARRGRRPASASRSSCSRAGSPRRARPCAGGGAARSNCTT